MTDIFDKPKQAQTKVESGQTRIYHGQDGYKKICKIKEVLPNNRVTFDIEGKHHEMPLRNIGDLCS